MSASTGEKIIVTALFLIIGLPPGLCSIYVTPIALGALASRDVEAAAFAALFGVPALIGYAIFGLMLWWLIRTWRSSAP